MPRARRLQHGFTLVEAIISAGLLGCLAVTATFFWVDSSTLVRTVNADSTAIADGRALLERLEREIREVNAGVYAFDVAALRSALSRLSSNNAQRELYLTDVVSILRGDG